MVLETFLVASLPHWGQKRGRRRSDLAQRSKVSFLLKQAFLFPFLLSPYFCIVQRSRIFDGLIIVIDEHLTHLVSPAEGSLCVLRIAIILSRCSVIVHKTSGIRCSLCSPFKRLKHIVVIPLIVINSHSFRTCWRTCWRRIHTTPVRVFPYNTGKLRSDAIVHVLLSGAPEPNFPPRRCCRIFLRIRSRTRNRSRRLHWVRTTKLHQDQT